MKTPFRSLLVLFLLTLGMGLANRTPAQARPSYGIAVGADGTVYFTDVLHLGRGTIWALRPNGHLDTLARDFHAHSLSLDENGILYAATGDDEHMLVTFLPNGLRDTVISTDNEEEFYGTNATISPSGEIFFGVNNHIWKCTDTVCQKVVELRLEWNPSLYVDGRGFVYATEVGSFNGELWKIDPRDSSFRVIASDLITSFPGRKRHINDDILLGISGDAYGNIYVAETAGRRVVCIDSLGRISTFMRSKKPWYPTGITFAKDVAYVLEYAFDSTWHGPRVVMVEKDGDRSVLVEIGAVEEAPVEEPLNKMPFIAVGVIVLVGVVVWLTFRGGTGAEDDTDPHAGAGEPDASATPPTTTTEPLEPDL